MRTLTFWTNSFIWDRVTKAVLAAFISFHGEYWTVNEMQKFKINASLEFF